jgi:DNA uptake protein ComE-like DNA-binding protein
MKIFKSHFWYSKRQRNGILFLFAIIISLQFIFYLYPFSPEEGEEITMSEIDAFQRERDSLTTLELNRNKVKLYPFNPNFISDFKGYQLGMSPKEIDKLHSYREQGYYVNSLQDFQKVTGVSDSLIHDIAPYFEFPDWKKKERERSKKKVDTELPIDKKDLNTAQLEDLKTIQGIGDKLASRIINYRTKLQGFTYIDQLNEVWYLEEAVVLRLLNYFEIKSPPAINRVNINEASFKEVLSLPYIDYELTKMIFNYKREVAEIQSIEDLKKIDGFPLDKFNRIALYLRAK